MKWLEWLSGFLCKRFRERSTYAHLVTCGGSVLCAAGALGREVPRWALGLLAILALVGALMPDAKVKPAD